MREKLIHISLIGCFAALFYVNSFGNFFVWNDWTLIIENFLVKDWSNLPEIFTTVFWKPLVGEPFPIYRPLVSLSFVADFSFWVLNPWGYHLTNVTLHVANSILAYSLMRVYVSPATALMASVLFAVHPIHTESVTYISGRGDLLMAFFLLSGAIVFLESGRRRSWPLYIASLPLFFLALLAKETAVIVPLLLIAADLSTYLSFRRTDLVRLCSRQIGPFMVVGAYCLWRKLFVGTIVSGYTLTAADFVHDLLLTLKAVPLYFSLLLFPVNLHFIHPLNFYSLLDVQLILSILLLLGAGWGLRHSASSGNRALGFALLWFVIGLLPLVYFIALNVPLLEGWTYLPSLGFALLIVLALDSLKYWTSSGAPLWLTLWIAVMLGGITFYRNRDWKDDMQISLHSIAAASNDPLALRLVGNAYMRRGNTPEAEKLFKKGLALAPRDPGLHRSMGALSRILGKGSETLVHYEVALTYANKQPHVYWLLGHYYLYRGRPKEAESYFYTAVKNYPYSSELRNNLAYSYYLQGKLGATEAELRAALRISPYSPAIKNNLEMVLKGKGP